MLIKEKIIEPVYLADFYIRAGYIASDEKKISYTPSLLRGAGFADNYQRDQDLT